ncbi:putative 14-3-3 domain superfamily protein [Helianthus anomalus]
MIPMLMDMGLEESSDGFDCKILFLEEGVDVDATGSASLFAATNDSVYQAALDFSVFYYEIMNSLERACPHDLLASPRCLLSRRDTHLWLHEHISIVAGL